jgi:para-nitrobenzyl esterase
VGEVLVDTPSGPVRGRSSGTVDGFLGIPYASAPVGALRFRRATAHRGWREPFDAGEFSPICPQPPPGPADSLPGDPTATSEDCLTVNIWTPSERRPGEALPVMVFIHGGGFSSGSGAHSLYRGDTLAARGVVVVTLNYRLGALGWLAHPALADETGCSGNWGLSDQVMALSWIGDNIASFGGDPGNVTIFGESAGAMSVAALLATEEARPLYHRAIMESGSATAVGMEAASELAEAVAFELGLSGVSLEALQQVPAERLVEAQQAVSGGFLGLGLPFLPVVDGGLLAGHPSVAIAQGEAAGIDLLVGTNRDEWAFFTYTTAALRGIDEERLKQLARRHVRFARLEDVVSADDFVAVIREARARRGEPVEPSRLYSAFGSEWVFRAPSLRLTEAHAASHPRTFSYLFDWETPFGGGALGSCHVLEIPFVFGTVRNPLIAVFSGGGPEAESLSSRMQAAWVAFASTGDPSCDVVGEWPVYTAARRATMRFGPAVEVVDAPMEEERAFLDGALGPYGEAETLSLERGRELCRSPDGSLDDLSPARADSGT